MLRVLAADDEAPALEELTYLLRRTSGSCTVHRRRRRRGARDIGQMIER